MGRSAVLVMCRAGFAAAVTGGMQAVLSKRLCSNFVVCQVGFRVTGRDDTVTLQNRMLKMQRIVCLVLDKWEKEISEVHRMNKTLPSSWEI